MKKKIFTIFLFTSISVFAQNNITKEDVDKQISVLNGKINSLKSENNKFKGEINNLNSNISNVNQKLETLDQKVQTTASDIQKTNSELNGKITNSETTTNQKFTQVDNSLSKNSLWSIIGILGAIIVSGLVYWLVSKRQTTDKTDVEAQISRTKLSIEESLVSEFGKQTELLETQIKILEQQKKNVTITQQEAEIDHSLALKVADEITLIERNISLMDQNVKGLKHLARSVSKLKDNLLANGYELPILLGKSYNQGMKVIISSSIPDENLEEGVEIITKVLKPQVNYKDIMIQTAQIEVSVG